MQKNLIFTDKEAAFLKTLVKKNVRFMIVGLSAAALQGAPVVTQDIDLWFENLSSIGIKDALRKVDGSYIPPTATTPPMFAGKNMGLFDIVASVDGIGSFRDEFRRAKNVPLGKIKVRVLPLDRIIKSKQAAGRNKDKLVIPVLKDALHVIRELKKKG